MSTTQVLLAFSVTILTIVLAVIGIYVALVLKEIRESVKKLPTILDNVIREQTYLDNILETAQKTTSQVSQAADFFTQNVVEPIGGIVSLVKTVRNFFPQKGNRTKTKEDSHE
ncbi:hypothetical protein CO015_02060 [candidate division WWE3 bacterium CG_4_8_14_3_um_filter_42_11]|uniref:DUF948 domain-containing protein n=1 Tax=candidate division WWE3 bacterium CG_4_8_14_3_um_filter_42_11 TaxID=1975076 RepID=A0A2M8G7F5_UNCKA|nr:MAG: hypothetical protein CO015_02060 [candidate division WWE3 bacterium CG_4_8_14_3_um_filter_42_11]